MTTAPDRTGIWLVGAKGGVATTVICGALAIRRGLAERTGLITDVEPLRSLALPRIEDLVFGGHDVRVQTLRESAAEIERAIGTLRTEVLARIDADLGEVEREIRPGVLFRSGSAIESLPDVDASLRTEDPAAAVERLAHDVVDFRRRNRLGRVVMVNVASTEPMLPPHADHAHAEGIERLLCSSAPPLIASSLYALAAARSGSGYVNFTPSPGALLPGIVETLTAAKVPFMGSDGKTGETLVKSALAPMFKYRNLRVLAWQGYNMLGDRDGQVLSTEENRQTKVRSKDQLLHDYLGYPLHSHVAIDYVPSLNDLKTAWDFIHFEGFLGVRMSLQFTWQGCDSILAAPLVLDLARLTALASSRGEVGALSHLALFFKSPIGAANHDLHQQFHSLMDYARRCGA